MQFVAWFNLTRKCYEAMLVGRGRPITQNASEDERSKSKRLIVTGKTRNAATINLAKALQVKRSELEEVPVKETGLVYKGRREHPYTPRSQAA